MVSQNKSVMSRNIKVSNLNDLLGLASVRKAVERDRKADVKTVEGYIRRAEGWKALRRIVERHASVLGITWYEFAHQVLKVEKNRRGVLIAVMNARTRKKQEAIVEAYLDKVNARAERHRLKTSGIRKDITKERRLPKWRKDFITWVRNASEEQAREAWRHVSRTALSLNTQIASEPSNNQPNRPLRTRKAAKEEP